MFCAIFLLLSILCKNFLRLLLSQELMSHHATEYVFRSWFLTANFSTNFFAASNLLLGSCVTHVLREILPGSYLIFASYNWACFAQFFTCSSLPNWFRIINTEDVLRNFFPAPRFLIDVASCYWVCFWPLIFQLEISSCYFNMFLRNFFPASNFLLGSCVTLLSMFCRNFTYSFRKLHIA